MGEEEAEAAGANILFGMDAAAAAAAAAAADWWCY